jgi:hypothetical protein
MVRQCDVCSAEYLAKRQSSRFCSDRCRKRANRGAAALAGHPTVVEVAPEEPSALVLAVTSELEAAGRLYSSLGQQAILLAARIGAPFDTGSSVARCQRSSARSWPRLWRMPRSAPTRSINCGLGDCASLYR